MRKDFILDRYGLLEARAAGAAMVLLIVAALEEQALQRLVTEARGLGLTPLVEVYTAEEARVAVEIGAELVGINNRNLHTFEVSLETTERLAPLLTPHALVVSLSGMSGPDDAARMAAAGARAVLIGEALVRAPDPAALIRSFTAVTLPETARPGATPSRDGAR
jgi:indole-3-glycerol phosphate synthase